MRNDGDIHVTVNGIKNPFIILKGKVLLVQKFVQILWRYIHTLCQFTLRDVPVKHYFFEFNNKLFVCSVFQFVHRPFNIIIPLNGLQVK